MSEMLERVAKAIWATEPMRAAQVRRSVWKDESEDTHNRYRPLARAAITAMREPTKAMVLQGELTIFEHNAGPLDWTMDATREGWQAMIDEALK